MTSEWPGSEAQRQWLATYRRLLTQVEEAHQQAVRADDRVETLVVGSAADIAQWKAAHEQLRLAREALHLHDTTTLNAAIEAHYAHYAHNEQETG